MTKFLSDLLLKGAVTLTTAVGTGNRMVIADADGKLGVQAIPGAGITGTGTAGQVTYWTGAGTQAGSNNLFWDAVNGRLGVGTNLPSERVEIQGASLKLLVKSTSGFNGVDLERSVNTVANLVSFKTGTTFDYAIGQRGSHSDLVFYSYGTNTDVLRLFKSTGNLLLQNGGTYVDGGQRLQVTGTSLFSDTLTVSKSASAAISVQSSDTSSSSTVTVKTGTIGGFFRAYGPSFIVSSLANTASFGPDGASGLVIFTHATLQSGASGFLSIRGGGYDTLSEVAYFDKNGTNLKGNLTAASGIARGTLISSTLIAAANNDVLVGLDVSPTYTTGAFTGLTSIAGRFVGDWLTLRNTAGALGSNYAVEIGVNANTPRVNFIHNGIASASIRTDGTDFTINSFINNTGTISMSTQTSSVQTTRLRMFNNGNIVIQNGGTFTDAGYKLDVNGTFRASGDVTVTTLEGTGSRMVVAGSDGKLSVQTIPSFTEVDTLDSVTDRGAATTNYLTVGRLTVLAASGGAELFLNSTATGGGQWSIGSYSSANTISNALGFYNPTASTTPLVLTPTKLQMLNAYQLIWTIDDYDYADVGIPNAGLAWEAANTLKVTNGSTGYGSFKLQNLTATGTASITGDLTVNSRFTVGSYDSGSGGSNINTYIELKNYNNDGYGEGIVVGYGRGSLAAPQNVQTGDTLGGYYWRAYSAGANRNLAYIEATVTGVGTYAKTRLLFATGADDSYAYVGMILNEDGKLFVGYNLVDQGAYRLQVGGAIYATNALLTGLAGTGTRMVVTDSTGTLSSQAIPTGSLQGAVDADKNTSNSLAVGTTIVKSVSATTYSGVFFDYVVKNGTNVRVGSVVAISNGTTVEFYETLSNDIGTTTALTFTVTLGSGNINLNAVAAATGWTVIVSTRAI